MNINCTCIEQDCKTCSARVDKLAKSVDTNIMTMLTRSEIWRIAQLSKNKSNLTTPGKCDFQTLFKLYLGKRLGHDFTASGNGVSIRLDHHGHEERTFTVQTNTEERVRIPEKISHISP